VILVCTEVIAVCVADRGGINVQCHIARVRRYTSVRLEKL
jgi:hypothetical protein